MMKSKKTAHLAMCILVFCWGLNMVVAKVAMDVLEPLALMLFRYTVAFCIITVITLAKEGFAIMDKSDILRFVICGLTGQVLYLIFQYEAMEYMAVSLVTIILTFVPAVSVILERIIYKRQTNKKIVIGIVLTICGVALVTASDIDTLFEGKALGYLFCIGAVLSWNCYNFLTASFKTKYTALSLSFNQIICALLITLPLSIPHLPSPDELSTGVVLGVVYLGIEGSIGYIVNIAALRTLGPTPVSVYSCLYPVTSTFLAWILLGETIFPLQMLGGVIVIATSCYIIREKGKLDAAYHDSK